MVCTLSSSQAQLSLLQEIITAEGNIVQSYNLDLYNNSNDNYNKS